MTLLSLTADLTPTDQFREDRVQQEYCFDVQTGFNLRLSLVKTHLSSVQHT